MTETKLRRRLLGLRKGKPTAESHTSGVARLVELFTLTARPKDYKPKFCRTRRCTQRFGHDGRCDGPQPSQVQVPRRNINIARRLSAPRYTVRHSPRGGGPTVQAREHMAEIRQRNTPQREHSRLLVQQQKVAGYKRRLAALRRG